MLDGEDFDRIAGSESVGETSAHHAGEDGDADSFAEVKFFDGGFLLLRRHDAFFRNSCQSGSGNAHKANENPEQNHAAGSRADDLSHEHAAENRRHEGAEGGAESEDDSHAEREAEIAHCQAKGEAANSP